MTAGETITKILSEQVKGCKTLVGLLQKERTCLLDLNAQGVEELSKEKDTLIMRLRLLEEERIRLVGKHFKGDVSLQKLWEQTGDDTLIEIRSTLLSLVQSIEELNEFNRLLIGRSLNYIKTTMSLFGFPNLNKSRGTNISREI